jgi:hypothetical protein
MSYCFIHHILGARGGLRRGGGSSFENAARGRSQRFNKFEGQQSSVSNNESSTLESAGDGWTTEGGMRGARGRGGPRRGNFEGGRGMGMRGRGRGGRGNFNNRSTEDGSQQENSGWQQTTE